MKFRPGLLLISCISFFTLTGFTGATDFCSPIYCDSPATDSDKPWYGISLPPGLAAPHKAPIDVSGFSPAPALVPPGEEAFTELDGDAIYGLMEEFVSISERDRASGRKRWGRITGVPGAQQEAAEWVAQKFDEAGLSQVSVQEYGTKKSLETAIDWELRLMGDEAFGMGSRDVVFESAFATDGVLVQPVTAPLKYVGRILNPWYIPRDLEGKIAVQVVDLNLNNAVVSRFVLKLRNNLLIRRGALGVITVVLQVGNMQFWDFASNKKGGSFNLGNDDGRFLLSVMAAAKAEGKSGQLLMRMSRTGEVIKNPKGYNAVGIVDGYNNEESIVINAHTDGYFDGANDNGDGVAVMVAMARHFAKPENKPPVRLIFVGSGGHHQETLNGPEAFVRGNKDLLDNVKMIVNIEHVAAMDFVPGSQWSVKNREKKTNIGVAFRRRGITGIIADAKERYGYRCLDTRVPFIFGDLLSTATFSGYPSLRAPMMQSIHTQGMYHSSGDVIEAISIPGLERAARFFTYFVDQTARL